MKKNVIGCQVGAISFVDEGVNHVLDFLHDEASVNSLFISSLSWARGNAGRGSMGYPDHGPQEEDHLQGGAFFKPDPQYYNNTFIKNFESPDPLYQGFDNLRDVIPEAKKRCMDTYVYFCETSRLEPRSLWVAGWPHLLQVDILGRRNYRPCYYNPEYRNWNRSVMEDYAKNHELTGLLWNLERKSPVIAVLDGEAPTCFCPHCVAEGRARNIDVNRAKEGLTKLYEYVRDCKNNVEMPDGYLATFLRYIMRYPEILQWENMWYEGHFALAKDMYGTFKWCDPKKSFGMGLWQVTDTFSLWLRSLYDYADFKECADFIKPILYHTPASSRFKGHVNKLHQSVFKDFDNLGLLTECLLNVIGQRGEPAYDQLHAVGFSADYITRNVQRILKDTDFTIPVMPGIPSGVPVGAGNVEAGPVEIEEAVKGAYAGGASGVILSRNFSEANLDNMRACKKAVQELALDVTSDVGAGADGEKSVY